MILPENVRRLAIVAVAAWLGAPARIDAHEMSSARPGMPASMRTTTEPVRVAGVGRRASARGVARQAARQGGVESRFALTSPRYRETDDLSGAIERELGAGYRLADWSQLPQTPSGLSALLDRLGVQHGETLYLTYRGSRWDGGTRRHFFMQRATPHAGAGVYARVGDLAWLGSWYGYSGFRALAYRAGEAAVPSLGAEPATAIRQQQRVLEAMHWSNRVWTSFLRQYAEAERAYDELKRTEGTELFASVEAATNEVAEQAGQEALQKVAEKGVATSAQKALVGLVGAGILGWELGRWLAIDATLISRNVRYRWQAFTRLRPLSAMAEQADRGFEAARRSEYPGDQNISVRFVGGSRIVGRCAVTWSGPATVTVYVVNGMTQTQYPAECVNGVWEVPASVALVGGQAPAFAVLSDGRRAQGVSAIAIW